MVVSQGEFRIWYFDRELEIRYLDQTLNRRIADFFPLDKKYPEKKKPKKVSFSRKKIYWVRKSDLLG